jgi:O-antigen ligase
MGYALSALALGRNRRSARTAISLLFAGLVVGSVVLASPLGDIIQLRLNSGYGDEARQVLYESSITAVSRSPILGYGAPISSTAVNTAGQEVGLSVGTHGQLWTVVVSHGIPGLVFFVGFWGIVLLKTRRRIPSIHGRDPDARFWAHVAIVAALVQLPYYQLMPWGLPIMMVAAALALREARKDGLDLPPGPSESAPAIHVPGPVRAR